MRGANGYAARENGAGASVNFGGHIRAIIEKEIIMNQSITRSPGETRDQRNQHRRNHDAYKPSARRSLRARQNAAMPAPYNAMGERLHALIARSAPALQPTLWYGMPAYAKGGKTICFFRADKKYMTFGLTQDANLAPEEGASHQLIESAWYFTSLDDATETRLSAIVRKVAGEVAG